MLMTAGEIAALQPDYVIMDESNRCGAEMWGQGVERLLAAFPHALQLGLSATAIRYLDNQQNMAEELLDKPVLPPHLEDGRVECGSGRNVEENDRIEPDRL